MSAQTNFYNRFSFLYPLVDVFLKPQKKKFFNEINQLPHGNLLEIGVGNGSHFYLYKNHKITGIEISTSMLNIARKNQTDNIELFQMNGEKLDFKDNIFDYVILSHVIAVADDPEKLLTQCLRVLKPNGKLFILNHFTPDNFLKYVDRIFNFCSKWLHLKSLFYIKDIKVTDQFKLEKEIVLKPFSYFRILIFAKP
ncbi:class I SAM-dependent methyltransferase [Pedobacter sp. UBA5917]|uniref:class I SAM-dependent methyltransferase n=1 Tax=Pedobacter sp. UBA5917 TaxID=1947061 RepID=UPI0025CF1E7A|nr:class I SAM-dependent methyltransferase [Pedobacter sp. UBA5917]